MLISIPRTFPAALLSMVLMGCGLQAQVPQSEPPAPVRVANPLPMPPRTVQAVGRLEADSERRMGFVAGGVLRRIQVDIGDRVEPGQILAEQDTTALDAAVRQADENLALARRDLLRAEELVGRQLLPRQQAEDARTRVSVAEAALRSARYPQRYARIVATEPGVVLRRLAEPGEVVGAGQAVLLLGTAGKAWRLRVELADRDALRVQPGSAASVRITALPGLELPAQVREIGGEAGAQSGAITVDLRLDPSDAPLRSGLVAHARLTLPGDARLGLPTSALLRASGRRGEVMVVEDGLAALREIELGELIDDRIAIVSGLSRTDTVIIEGAAWADPGQLVTPASPR